jgi:hypothetical protein
MLSWIMNNKKPRNFKEQTKNAPIAKLLCMCDCVARVWKGGEEQKSVVKLQAQQAIG